MDQPEYVVWMDTRFNYVLEGLKELLGIKEKETGKEHPYLRMIIKDMECQLSKK